MKTIILTPNSSVKSSTTMDGNQSEIRDSHYFPGCRKDTNCGCEICVASMNATLDLMPQSFNRNSLTKGSASRPTIPRSPVSFDPSWPEVSTPIQGGKIRPVTVSPPLDSTARLSFHEEIKRRKRDLGYGFCVLRFVLGLILVFSAEYGFSWMVSGVLKPKLSPDMVKNMGEKSMGFKGLKERMCFVKIELQDLVNTTVPDCGYVDSVWKINQDGLLLHSRCMLYKTMAEEVSILGWPLHTTGLLTAEHSSRSLTVISGKVTQWSDGHVSYLIRESNSSWTQGRWSASAVQFDPNTWVLEYRPSLLVENARLVSATMEFLTFRLTREFEKMKQGFWLLPAFGDQYTYTSERRIPT